MLIGKFEAPFVVLSFQLSKFFGAFALFVEETKFDVGRAVGGPEATCWIIGMPSQLKSLPSNIQI